MKFLTVMTIFVLVFSTISSISVTNVYAQEDLDILFRIASHADKQIYNQIERTYGDSIPSDIQDLYDDGHLAVVSIENSLHEDKEQARQDFLTAMSYFKQITRMIATPSTELRLSDASERDLQSELNRLYKYFENLKLISDNHNTGIDFSEIERLFEVAQQQIEEGHLSEATNTITQLTSLIEAIKKNIHEHASHTESDRVIDFAKKQLSKIKDILVNAEQINSNSSEIANAQLLIDEIETLISENNIFDAKEKFIELIKIVKVIEKSIQ